MEKKIESKKPEGEILLVKESGSFDLIIPLEVEQKINFMCKKISAIEWSGTLFYKPEGKYEDNTLKIRCVDFFPMDIGTSIYTEFNMSPEVIGYMTENPELLDCQMGLIHSHNHMATFFSKTDTDTLLAEGKDCNHFVSLIVNNAGEYTAGITKFVTENYKIEAIQSYHTFEDEILTGTPRNLVSQKSKVLWRNLNIIKEIPEEPFQDILAARIETIRKAKEEAAKARIVTPPSYGVGAYQYGGYMGNKTPVYEDEYEDYYGDYDTKPYNPTIKYGEYVKPVTKKEPKLPFSPPNSKHIDSTIIETTVKQLLTGSVILPNDTKISLVDWSKSMTSLFEKRFGVGDAGMNSFETWADSYIDFLVWDIDDPKLDPNEDICAIGAQDMIAFLSTLPRNVYIDYFIEALKAYKDE